MGLDLGAEFPRIKGFFYWLRGVSLSEVWDWFILLTSFSGRWPNPLLQVRFHGQRSHHNGKLIWKLEKLNVRYDVLSGDWKKQFQSAWLRQKWFHSVFRGKMNCNCHSTVNATILAKSGMNVSDCFVKITEDDIYNCYNSAAWKAGLLEKSDSCWTCWRAARPGSTGN